MAVSLAEAETLRRVLHVRLSKEVLNGQSVQLAMHMSMQGHEVGKVDSLPPSPPTSLPPSSRRGKGGGRVTLGMRRRDSSDEGT